MVYHVIKIKKGSIVPFSEVKETKTEVKYITFSKTFNFNMRNG